MAGRSSLTRRKFLGGSTATVGSLAIAGALPRVGWTAAADTIRVGVTGRGGPDLPDTAAPEARKPDVLVILTDQWSPRYVGWNNPGVRTPNLDRIAREGMIFDRCYATSPICMPSRVSLITGLYPHNHGHALWGNAQEYHAPPEHAPMFRDIRRAGYITAQIGKLHWASGGGVGNAFPSVDDYHRSLGLDFVIDVGGPPDHAKARDPYAEHLRALGLLDAVAGDMRSRYLANQYEPHASVAPAGHYHDAFVADQAVKFIGGQPPDRPICLVVSFHSPHPPLDAPGDYATMFDPERIELPANVPERFVHDGRTLERADVRRMAANYLGKIAFVDTCVGRLVEAMKARGTWDGALVAFTADHGEMMGAHGALSKGRFWEESARVPFALRWPGRIAPGRTAALAQMFDLYPTIVEAIGGDLSPGRMATSLLPVAEGRATGVRDTVIGEIGSKSPLRMMICDGRHKWWADDRGEALFDLDADPLEMTNLAADPDRQPLLHRMRERMLTHLRSTQVNHSEGYIPKVQRMRSEERRVGKECRYRWAP